MKLCLQGAFARIYPTVAAREFLLRPHAVNEPPSAAAALCTLSLASGRIFSMDTILTNTIALLAAAIAHPADILQDRHGAPRLLAPMRRAHQLKMKPILQENKNKNGQTEA